MSSKAGKLKLGGRSGSKEKARSGRDSRQGADSDRPSVFSRLGTKMGGPGWRGAGGPSPARRKDGEKWEENILDGEDQTTLEKKREMLQRELAKEMKDIQESGGKKRVRSSSSSSTSSSTSTDSSSSDSSSSTSSESSSGRKKKRRKRDSSSDSQSKRKKKKSKSSKKKKTDSKKKKSGKKKDKLLKDKDSPKRKDSPKKEPEKVKVNVVRAGGQERDKFGFYIAPQALQALKEKTPERKRSHSRTPERRERRRSHSGGRREKERRRDSRDRRTRDVSPASRADRRSPQRSGRSPRGRSPVGRQRSVGRTARRPTSRGSSREKEKRDGGRERSRDRDRAARKDDLKDDLRNSLRDPDRRREDKHRREDERSLESRQGARSDRDDDRRKRDPEDDFDLKWGRRDESPRRGRGRGRKRRGESLTRQESLGRGRRREERSRSRGRDSPNKSGSVELRLDTSRELLNSPSKLSADSKDEKNGKEEDLAEDFSDFGDSDDDILNQEESDSREGGEVRDSESRPTSGLSGKKDGDLGEFERDEATVSSANESEETIKTNARLADALGADWSQLLQKETPRVAERGDARKRWSLAEIIRRVGLSQKMIGGEENYNRFLAKINSDLPEEEKVVLLDPRPWQHITKTSKLAAEKRLLTELGGCRALSARSDINIRRFLNNINSQDTGLPVCRVNTNMDLYNQARNLLAAKMKEMEESKARVGAAAYC